MKTFLANFAETKRHAPAGRRQALGLDAARCAAGSLPRGGHRFRHASRSPRSCGSSPYLFFIPAVLVAPPPRRLGPSLAPASTVLGLVVITTFPSRARNRQRRCIRSDRAGIAWSETANATVCESGDRADDAMHAGSRQVDCDTVPDAMIVIDERGSSIPSARLPSGCSALRRRKSSAASARCRPLSRITMATSTHLGPERENHRDRTSWSASAGSRPFRWNSPWEKCARAISASSRFIRDLTGVSSRGKARNCNPSSSISPD